MTPADAFTRLPGPGLVYGADYNPEQWPAATLDEDIELMLEAGVTLVSVGIFSWATLEPEPGRFEWAWLDRVLDRLADAGISADLGTATASPPPWLARLHPDSLPVTAQGVRLSPGSRQQICPTSPQFRRYAARLVRALADRYAHHPALALFHVGNEYGCHVAECFCDRCAHGFQDWLWKRYADVGEVNAAWGTQFWSQSYARFEEIAPPRAMPTFPNPAQVLDWRRYCCALWRELYDADAAIVRAATPHVPVTTNFMGLFTPLDYWSWARGVDIVSDDSYPDPADPRSARQVAFTGDLMRSLGGGAPFLLLEQTTSAVQWRPRNSPKRPGQYVLWSLARVARGADGICNFQWRASRAGAEQFHSGMVAHSGRRSRTWPQVTRLGEVLARLAPVRGERVAAQVAMVLDWEAMWAREAVVGPTVADAGAPYKSWHATCFEAGLAVDFVRPEDDLRGYRLVIVPPLFLTRADAADRLEEAAAAGAHVLVQGPSGVVDERMHAHLGGYLGPLAPLLGVSVLDHCALTGDAVTPWEDEPVDAATSPVTAVIDAPAARWGLPLRAVGPAGLAGRGRGWAEDVALDRDDVAVEAEFATDDLLGLPALTRRAHGSGVAWYLATDLDAPSRAALLTHLTRAAGVAPDLAGLPAGVEARRRGPVLFVLNHGDRDVTVEVPPGHDLVADRPASGTVRLPARDALALHLDDAAT